MTMKCSRNLTKHLKLLKQECNEIVTLQQNGYRVEKKQLTDYLQHKNYVTTLLHAEKMKAYDKLILKSR